MRAVSRALKTAEAAFCGTTAASSLRGVASRCDGHACGQTCTVHASARRAVHTRRATADVGRRDAGLPPTTRSRTFHTSAASYAPRRDPYDVLGVGRGASKDEVKKSYYKLVKQ